MMTSAKRGTDQSCSGFCMNAEFCTQVPGSILAKTKRPRLPAPPRVAKAPSRIVQVPAFGIGAHPIIGVAMCPLTMDTVLEPMIATHCAKVIPGLPLLQQLTPGGAPHPGTIQLVAADPALASPTHPCPRRWALLLNVGFFLVLHLNCRGHVLLHLCPHPCIAACDPVGFCLLISHLAQAEGWGGRTRNAGRQRMRGGQLRSSGRPRMWNAGGAAGGQACAAGSFRRSSLLVWHGLLLRLRLFGLSCWRSCMAF